MGSSLQNDDSYTYRIVIVGDSGCGKTCLLTRYTEDLFFTNFHTTVGMSP